MTKGNYSIGFVVNSQKYFHVKLAARTIIGGYENLFGHTSEFYFKALNFVEGYGLRKQKLVPIL